SACPPTTCGSGSKRRSVRPNRRGPHTCRIHRSRSKPSRPACSRRRPRTADLSVSSIWYTDCSPNPPEPPPDSLPTWGSTQSLCAITPRPSTRGWIRRDSRRGDCGFGPAARGDSTRRQPRATLPTVTTERPSGEEYRARVLDADHELLARLRGDPCIEIVDAVGAQQRTLAGLLPPPALTDEPTRWAYYPWRRAVVAVVGPRAFRRARLDRNRNLISAADQDRLVALRVGGVGLSVGHAVAYTAAAQGVCGSLRLADFDDLELTNLNRVPATVFDLGVNKAVIAARRIAELDPYLDVDVMTSGLTAQTLDEFLDGVDILVEECDALDMKVRVRQAARARRLPVLMATSDRGLVDIERFDLTPHRPILHGLLGDA